MRGDKKDMQDLRSFLPNSKRFFIGNLANLNNCMPLQWKAMTLGKYIFLI